MAQYSPAVWNYWLNFNLIVKVEGVLYQEIIDPISGAKYHLLVPKVLRQEVIVKCHDHIFGAHMGISKTTEKLKSQFHVGHPMDRIALDIIGQLPRSKRDNQYILVIGDHFSRWMEAYPLPNQMAEKFIARFGVPLEVNTYQGVILNLISSKKCVHCLMLRKQGPQLIGPLPMDSLKNCWLHTEVPHTQLQVLHQTS